MVKKMTYCLLFLCVAFNTKAQDSEDNNKKLVQLSGVVVSSDKLEPMPFCSVYNKTTKSGTISDYYGYFSLVARHNDTLIFSYIGYEKNAFIVPDTLKTFSHALIHMMEPDTITAQTVVVYPWPSKEDFARAFIEMKPYDDALRRAQRQLTGEKLQRIALNMPSDAGLTYSWQRQQHLNMLYDQAIRPVSNLLNPIAWAQFIQAWKNGDFKRKR